MSYLKLYYEAVVMAHMKWENYHHHSLGKDFKERAFPSLSRYSGICV